MTRRGRIAVPIVCGAAILSASVFAVFHFSQRKAPMPGWSDDLRAAVQIVDGDRTYDVELTDFGVVEGRVSYEGPRMIEGEANWKEAHTYRGIDLGVLIDRTVDRSSIETLTVVALDGWNMTLPSTVLEGRTACGRVILALSRDGKIGDTWDDGPLLIFLPEDGQLSNRDMLDSLGSEYAHFFGAEPSTTGLLVKGVAFLVVDHDGGSLPTFLDL